MSSSSVNSRRAGSACVLLCLVGLTSIIVGAGLLRSHAQSPAAPAAADPQLQPSAHSPAPSQAEKAQSAADAVAAQKQQIAKESADLLKMATALKIEVDKTNQDTLSVSVVRKASDIEQLARKAKSGGGKS